MAQPYLQTMDSWCQIPRPRRRRVTHVQLYFHMAGDDSLNHAPLYLFSYVRAIRNNGMYSSYFMAGNFSPSHAPLRLDRNKSGQRNAKYPISSNWAMHRNKNPNPCTPAHSKDTIWPEQCAVSIHTALKANGRLLQPQPSNMHLCALTNIPLVRALRMASSSCRYQSLDSYAMYRWYSYGWTKLSATTHNK